jgi:hypothetical protein
VKSMMMMLNVLQHLHVTALLSMLCYNVNACETLAIYGNHNCNFRHISTTIL